MILYRFHLDFEWLIDIFDYFALHHLISHHRGFSLIGIIGFWFTVLKGTYLLKGKLKTSLRSFFLQIETPVILYLWIYFQIFKRILVDETFVFRFFYFREVQLAFRKLLVEDNVFFYVLLDRFFLASDVHLDHALLYLLWDLLPAIHLLFHLISEIEYHEGSVVLNFEGITHQDSFTEHIQTALESLNERGSTLPMYFIVIFWD